MIGLFLSFETSQKTQKVSAILFLNQFSNDSVGGSRLKGDLFLFDYYVYGIFVFDFKYLTITICIFAKNAEYYRILYLYNF